MKKSKKFISLILAIIMLMSVMPMQIFAVGPTLEKIEFSDNAPVSNQMIQQEASSYSEITESTRVHMDHLDYDKYYYDYNLYFSNGKVCDTADYYLIYPIGVYDVFCYPWVSPLECQRAIDEGIPYVNVYVSVTVDKLIGADEEYEFVVQKKIVEGIVKDIRLADSMPESYNEDAPGNDFIGKTFEVEFFDGTVETHKITADEDFGIPCINDEWIYFDFEFEKEVNEETGEVKVFRVLKIEYLDKIATFYKEEVPLNYSAIKILDYKFDKKGGVTYIKYSLTYNDGKVIEREYDFEVGIGADTRVKCDTIDGNNVTLQNSIEDGGGRYYVLSLSIGFEDLSVSDDIQGEAKDCCNCICHKDGFLYLVSFFLLKIWGFFRMNEFCKCNSCHW